MALILAELLTFGIFFLSYAFARTFEVALFNASQRTLDFNYGAINTVLLITGSWCVLCRPSSVTDRRWARAGLWPQWPAEAALW
jgi:nitric oxide reductase NorE protein